MATLAQLRELIIRRLSGGDPSSDTQLDDREIDMHILQAANAAIKIEYYTNIKAEDVHGVSYQYIYTSVLDVQKDQIRGEEYIILPVPYVALPNDKGIHQIDPMNGKCKTFIPVKNGSIAMYRGTAAGNLEGNTGFYPERNKVYFTKPIICQGTSKVRVKQIVAHGDDTVFDPSIEETIVRSVLEMMMPRLPQDRVANNRDETTMITSGS
jgi:hypothetical protein